MEHLILYHTNLFHLLKHEPLPVFRYTPSISPKPSNKPQLYQILGAIAKTIMHDEKIPVITTHGILESFNEPIKNFNHETNLGNDLKFKISLTPLEETTISIDNFDEYKLLVNRIIDIAVTQLKTDYYKFHPDAPYLIKDEPYFDKDLIEKTGIRDSKKYYRSVYKFQDKFCILLDRETDLSSDGNLLNELRALQKNYESLSGNTVDFSNPSEDFVSFVNSMIRGKTARVKKYPGPSVSGIKEITWDLRAKDTLPDSDISPISYFEKNYGIKGLDPEQPLVMYYVEHSKTPRYHIPELLTLGHNFKDLVKRIPGWQRRQVWGSIQPDCKNQLKKTYELLSEIDASLRQNMPSIYPALLEFSTFPLDASELVTSEAITELQFAKKTITVTSPYSTDFYKKYSKKQIQFVENSDNLSGLIHIENDDLDCEPFLEELKNEFTQRTGKTLSLTKQKIDFENNNFIDYNFVLTIINKDDKYSDILYKKCKKIIQNDFGVIHQHLSESSANSDSVMSLIMDLALKTGTDPWHLAKNNVYDLIVGIHTYSNPFTKEDDLIVSNIFNNVGKLVHQFEPIHEKDFEELFSKLLEKCTDQKTVFLISHDKYDISSRIKSNLSKKSFEYIVLELIDRNHLRFFKTWKPTTVRRFGKKAQSEINRIPIESDEKAPEGISIITDNVTFYLSTGRTVEINTLNRGCPEPTKISVVSQNGAWDFDTLSTILINSCMMSRVSGFMTRMPQPIYYLQKFANYYNQFGLPKNDNLKQKIFYV